MDNAPPAGGTIDHLDLALVLFVLVQGRLRRHRQVSNSTSPGAGTPPGAPVARGAGFSAARTRDSVAPVAAGAARQARPPRSRSRSRYYSGRGRSVVAERRGGGGERRPLRRQDR